MAKSTVSGSQTEYVRGDGTFQPPPAASTGGSAGGDLSGTYPNPVVASIQGTAISPPPGGTTEFLRGDGTWDTLQYGDLPSVITPTGDTSGADDSAMLNEVAAANPWTRLAPGQWYIQEPGLTTSARWVQGFGPGTVVNVVPGAGGWAVVGPGQLVLSDMAIAVGAGAYALTVNGAYDANFSRLYLSGSTADGGIKIDGDDACEQNYTDIVLRNMGGIAFDLERTGYIYTGSLYLDRVRSVTPPAGGSGVRLNCTYSGQAALNTISMNECVFDAYYNDAYYADNVAQIFVTDSWFAVGSFANSGQVGMRIIGGYQQTYKGNYSLNGGSGTAVSVQGDPTGVYIGAGHIFDGVAGTTALSLASCTNPSGFQLGDYLTYCGTLTDSPSALTASRLAKAPYSTAEPLASGEAIVPRNTMSVTDALTSGTMALTAWTAATSGTATNIKILVGGQAASGLTYANVGIYSVNPVTGAATLVASTGDIHATGAFGSTYTEYPLSLTSNFVRTAGQRYAVGVLLVGSQMPQIFSANVPFSFSYAQPWMAATYSSLASLPSSFTYGNLGEIGSMPAAIVYP